MLAIKLQRIGKKHQPGYRIVVAEARSKMAAPPVEDLGSYNPFTKAFAVSKERVAHWMKVGAKPTATAHNLLVSKQIISGKKITVKMKKKADSTGSVNSPQASSPQVAEAAAVESKATEAVVETATATDLSAVASAEEETPAAEEKPTGE